MGKGKGSKGRHRYGLLREARCLRERKQAATMSLEFSLESLHGLRPKELASFPCRKAA